MIYKSETQEAYENRLKEWHKWFAWYPVRISDTTKVWFEVIDRRLVDIRLITGYDSCAISYDFEYRRREKEKSDE